MSPNEHAGMPLGLTNAQELLWASQQLHPDAPFYTMAFLFDIDGPIEEAAFARAFEHLVRDADALRIIVGASDGRPHQVVLDHVDFVLPVIDLTGAPDPDAAASEWAHRRCSTPLDVGVRTFDAALLRLGPERHAWYLSQHHLVADAWAFSVLYERMEERYRQAVGAGEVSDLPPLTPFTEHVEQERAARDVAGAAPPSRRTREADAAAALYGVRTEGHSPDSERLFLELSDARSEDLRTLARTPGVQALTPDLSVFQLFATALFAYLHRVSGQTTITIGAPVHNRSSAAARRSPGLFVEVYPLDVTVDDDDTFASLHAKVRTATAAFLGSVGPGRAAAGANRGVNTVLNYITSRFDAFSGMPTTATWLHSGSMDAHLLRLQIHDFSNTGRFTLLFDINAEAFDAEVRSAIPDHFSRVFDSMVDGWQGRLADVDLLDGQERADVERALNGATEARSEGRDVVARILARTTELPDATAITDGHRAWTYADLDRVTASVASVVEEGSVVGIAYPRSAEAVLAMIGVLRAGAAYVPIDPTWPEERIAFVVEDAGCALVLAEGAVAADVPTMPLQSDHVPATDRGSPIDGGDLAYVLYTSGSTGTPKGVMVEHGSLANYVAWASSFYDGGRRLAFPLFTPLTFDLTVTSIFVPLVSGGSIRVYGEDATSADLSVLDVFDDDAVDIVKLTPSHLAMLGDRPGGVSRIRQLIVGGEDLTTAVARRIHERFDGRVSIHNEYGPTEATVGCIVHTYDPLADVGGSVPIGRPIDGMRAHVLDRAGQPVPFGVPGDLWVAGAGVARGYAGRPDLTAERFVPSELLGEWRMYATGDVARVRPDGTIEYLGRRDDQVKIRGVRVELGEVEAAIASHPGVVATAAKMWRHRDRPSADELVRCSRCGLGSDYPGVSFDAERVCSECRSFDSYVEVAQVYFKPEDELREILTSGASSGAEYDCISLLSGGKDSTYVLCRLVDMGLRVLAFTLDNGYISDQAKANISRVVDTLGVDHVFATTPAMNEIFVDSLQRHANVCQGCFKTIYTLSMQMAHDTGIPFIVTGLSRGQFFETRLTKELFTELAVTSDQIDADVLEARKAYHRVDDAVRRRLDVGIFDDDRIFDEVRFVDFYRYVDVSLDELYAYLGERVPWVRPTDTGRSTNCLINDVGIYYHTRTRGHHNYALPYSWDVRLGHKTRDAALEELDDDIDVAEVARILHEIGFPEDVTEHEAGHQLVSYYAAPVEIPMPELRAIAAQRLPSQIVPTRFIRVDAIPLTGNGKVDRDALPDPDTSRPEIGTVFMAPRTERETVMTRIWEDVIGIHGIGVRDDFFELGGDSIMAIQIVARAHHAGIEITLPDLFEALTIERLAARVGVGEGTPSASPPPRPDLPEVPASEMDKLASVLEGLGDRR